jgi:L-ascorbate metabolism protein UlaG (beta-lactamase superfamily)
VEEEFCKEIPKEPKYYGANGVRFMIQPVLMEDALLRDVSQASAEQDMLHLWWLGQSGFLIQWQGTHLLLDPYLSDSLTKKYSGTDKPHVRMTARAIAPERLDFIDVVTSSHNHTDHLDGETLGALIKANPDLTILVSDANREFAAERLQIAPGRLTGINPGTPAHICGFTFQAVPSAHEKIETDALGRHKFIGLVIQVGPWTLYHSGDTVRYSGMENLLKERLIDLGLLPINGHDPARGVAGNLSGPEAAQLAHDSGMNLVIPCHYEMFEFNSASPQAFIQAAHEIGQPYRILKCGERFSLG